MDIFSIPGINLPHLEADGSNWTYYSERISNAIQATEGLGRHFRGTARRPADLIERNGRWFADEESTTPISDAELKKYEDAVDEYETKEAQVREIIYGTIDSSTLMAIKNEKTATSVWNKLRSIQEDRTSSLISKLIMQLQMSRCVEGSNMRVHLAHLAALKARLDEISTTALADSEYITYICTSVSLCPSYFSLIATLDADARHGSKPISSNTLIQHIIAKYDADTALQETINKSDIAMLTVHNGRSEEEARVRRRKRKNGIL